MCVRKCVCNVCVYIYICSVRVHVCEYLCMRVCLRITDCKRITDYMGQDKTWDKRKCNRGAQKCAWLAWHVQERSREERKCDRGHQNRSPLRPQSVLCVKGGAKVR